TSRELRALHLRHFRVTFRPAFASKTTHSEATFYPFYQLRGCYLSYLGLRSRCSLQPRLSQDGLSALPPPLVVRVTAALKRCTVAEPRAGRDCRGRPQSHFARRTCPPAHSRPSIFWIRHGRPRTTWRRRCCGNARASQSRCRF